MGSTPGIGGATTVLLPWQDGIDRATGGPSENPTSFADLRNIVWFPGAVRLRPGLGDAVATLSDPVVCSVGVFQAYGLLIWVLYDGTDVNVVQTNLQGQSEVAVGTFGALNASAQTPPRFTFAESFGILVVAHDEPNVVYRYDTMRFDPADTGNEWDTIDASLDGGVAAPVVFRGVVTHLGAVWGWGYGSASDPDRPEVLRRSSPDDPTVYVAEQYVQFGARLDPIIGCAPVQSSLGVFKGSSWYRLDGNTAATFSPQLVDPVIGLVSAQAIQNIEGTLYWWSPYGPRSTTGGVTVDISGPLDLTGPLPSDLPQPGPGIYAFTYYSPDNQKLGFAFPNPESEAEVTVAYCVSLQGPLRWSLDEIQRTVLCAVLASTGQASIAIDPGSADNVTVVGAQGDAVASATIGWDNVNCVGDESVEIWGSMNGGTWTLLTTVPVNLVTQPQSVTVSGGILTSGTLDVAIRHRRLGRYLATYTDPDPSMWPAASQGSGTIVAIPNATTLSSSYDHTTGTLSASWAYSDSTVDIDLRWKLYWEAPISVLPPNANGIAGTATTTAILAQPPATVAWSGTTFGTGTFPSPVTWLPWVSNTGTDAIAIARNGGMRMQLEIRGRVGAITGAWVTSTVYTFIGVPESPTVNALWQTTSVALGSLVETTWSDVAYASGASTVNTRTKFKASATPGNSGCVTPTPGDTNYATVLNTTGTSPETTAAPFCATCLSVGQGVVLEQGVARQRITKDGFTHWSLTVYPGQPAFGGCTV